ncbi:MAG: D-glycero-beta-D-manno-heptose 1-phosphate adenylyltransferase [Bacteroidota bacterium]
MQPVDRKIYDWPGIQQQVEEWREAGQQLVFTNGCFDLLHFGHIHYLTTARALGNRLIVGLNSDASIQRLKGPHRPIKEQRSRLYVLAALACVDAVVPFEEDTPLELIQLIQPDLLVKGGDWQPHQIVGSDIVLERGGKVLSLPYVEGYSTTALEQKIRKA